MNKCPECGATVEFGMPETYLTNNGLLHASTQCVKHLKSNYTASLALQHELVEALKHLMYRFECAPSCAKLLNDLIARAEKTLCGIGDWGDDDQAATAKEFAAQIREAVEEAEKKVYDDYAKDFIKKEEALMRRIFPVRAKAKAEAYEDAAKIAESHMDDCSPATYYECLECFKEVGEAIRARAKEMK